MTSPDSYTTPVPAGSTMLSMVDQQIAAAENELRRLCEIRALLIKAPSAPARPLRSYDPSHAPQIAAFPDLAIVPDAGPPSRSDNRAKPSTPVVPDSTLTYHDLAHRIMLTGPRGKRWSGREVHALMKKRTGHDLKLSVAHCALGYGEKLGLFARVGSSLYVLRKLTPRTNKKIGRLNRVARTHQ